MPVSRLQERSWSGKRWSCTRRGLERRHRRGPAEELDSRTAPAHLEGVPREASAEQPEPSNETPLDPSGALEHIKGSITCVSITCVSIAMLKSYHWTKTREALRIRNRMLVFELLIIIIILLVEERPPLHVTEHSRHSRSSPVLTLVGPRGSLRSFLPLSVFPRGRLRTPP